MTTDQHTGKEESRRSFLKLISLIALTLLAIVICLFLENRDWSLETNRSLPHAFISHLYISIAALLWVVGLAHLYRLRYRGRYSPRLELSLMSLYTSDLVAEKSYSRKN